MFEQHTYSREFFIGWNVSEMHPLLIYAVIVGKATNVDNKASLRQKE